MSEKEKGLSLGKVTMFAIGATLASGIFSLSGDFAAGGAYPLAVLAGWAISGFGMLMLTLCFFRLSLVRPDLTSGLYSYARCGFGEYIGFNSAWGFWLSALLGNLSFITLFFSSLGNFFPVFGNGTNLLSLALGSAMVWGFALLISRGVSGAIAINTAVVAAKIIPIAVMIGAIVFSGAFDIQNITADMTGAESGIPIMDQIKSTVYTTVWVFIGIEGAVVISGRAKTPSVAGKATVLAFICLFVLYVGVSVLSMGVMKTEELAGLGDPPMAYLLEACVDSIYGPATQRCFPRAFTRQNKNGAPVGGVLITAIVIQLFLVVIYFNSASYRVIYTLSTSAIMVPYALSAFYCLKLSLKGKGLPGEPAVKKALALITSVLASLYGVWMLYASDPSHLLVSALLYAPGTVFYVIARRETGEKIFPAFADKAAFAALIAMAALSLIFLSPKL